MSFTDEQKQIMRDAIETYGIPAQTDMMIEEMSELTKVAQAATRPGMRDGRPSCAKCGLRGDG